MSQKIIKRMKENGTANTIKFKGEEKKLRARETQQENGRRKK